MPHKYAVQSKVEGVVIRRSSEREYDYVVYAVIEDPATGEQSLYHPGNATTPYRFCQQANVRSELTKLQRARVPYYNPDHLIVGVYAQVTHVGAAKSLKDLGGRA